VHDTALLQLLHLADSALPIGAAAHSFGLETLVEDGVLRAETLGLFFEDYLTESGTLEAWFVSRAWRGEDSSSLTDEFSARRPARESREASLKLGRRFAALANAVTGEAIPGDLHYSIAFGVAGAMLAIPERAVVLAYLQQSIAGLISSCQRLMPLGQIAAGKISWTLKPGMIAAVDRATSRERISCFTPLPEIASMRHGSIDTRLFIS
jgi:urease accessory protein